MGRVGCIEAQLQKQIGARFGEMADFSINSHNDLPFFFLQQPGNALLQ
jgi:hypothetical protein